MIGDFSSVIYNIYIHNLFYDRINFYIIKFITYFFLFKRSFKFEVIFKHTSIIGLFNEIVPHDILLMFFFK